MAMSGSTLPQVSSGGSISGTVHIVTTDGAGPDTAIVDPTGTGAFSTGTKMTVTQQVPGTKGNIAAPKQRRFVTRMLVNMGIVKRASNVNEDYPFAATMPAGTTCSGTVAGQSGVCLVKIVNPSNTGPFGGVIAVQMAGANASTAAAPATNSAAKASKPVGAKFRA
jgi:Egh16-like virulence factor